jgi:nucleoside-diphosphate-sugar epimerase
MKVIAVTGASGFVGKNLVPYLKGRELNVLELSRKNDPQYESIGCDFLNRNSVFAVVHLAGKAHDLRRSGNDQDYFEANTELTKRIFAAFLKSDASVFIYLSSVKAAADHIQEVLTESSPAQPLTAYGKSKLAAEDFLMENIVAGKKVYILRPCMIHGPGNKGNLNLLYRVARAGLPYPFAAFDNRRSFLSIENLCFVIKELIEKCNTPSGVYHVCDDDSLSTNRVFQLIAETIGIKPKLWRINKSIVRLVAHLGDVFRFPVNSERLQKLTENYVVSNEKLLSALNTSLPVAAESGLKITIQSFVYDR